MSDHKVLEEANNVIFRKMEIGDYCIVHLKESMEPRIYDQDSKTLYVPPEGYMKFDNDNFQRRRRIAGI
jgi:hypothetical protein